MQELVGESNQLRLRQTEEIKEELQDEPQNKSAAQLKETETLLNKENKKPSLRN